MHFFLENLGLQSKFFMIKRIHVTSSKLNKRVFGDLCDKITDLNSTN